MVPRSEIKSHPGTQDQPNLVTTAHKKQDRWQPNPSHQKCETKTRRTGRKQFHVCNDECGQMGRCISEAVCLRCNPMSTCASVRQSSSCSDEVADAAPRTRNSPSAMPCSSRVATARRGLTRQSTYGKCRAPTTLLCLSARWAP